MVSMKNEINTSFEQEISGIRLLGEKIKLPPIIIELPRTRKPVITAEIEKRIDLIHHFFKH